MQKRKPLVLGIALVSAAAMAVSATYAWFTAQESVTNKFKTARIEDGSVNIIEEFTPPTEWKPGQKVTKDVKVANNGAGAVFVRVSYDELLKNLKVDPQTGKAYSALWDEFTNIAPGKIQIAPFNVPNYSQFNVISSGNTITFPATANSAERIFKIYESDAETNGADLVSKGIVVQGKYTAPAAANGNATYSFVAYRQIGTGADAKYQALDLNIKVTLKKNATDTAENTVVLNPAGIGYKYYEVEGPTDKNWPVLSPKADSTSEFSDLVSLEYDAALVDTFAVDTWYFNKADNYFYYIGALNAGTVTPSLLKSVQLDDNARSGGIEYDLTVNMQAIQNTKEALNASDGWNLPAGAVFDALAVYAEQL